MTTYFPLPMYARFSLKSKSPYGFNAKKKDLTNFSSLDLYPLRSSVPLKLLGTHAPRFDIKSCLTFLQFSPAGTAHLWRLT